MADIVSLASLKWRASIKHRHRLDRIFAKGIPFAAARLSAGGACRMPSDHYALLVTTLDR